MSAPSLSRGGPPQLRIKAVPRALPPVTRRTATRLVSAELPVPGGNQLERDFDEYLAGLPDNDITDPPAIPIEEEPAQERDVHSAVNLNSSRNANVTRRVETGNPATPDPLPMANVAIHLQQPKAGANRFPAETISNSATTKSNNNTGSVASGTATKGNAVKGAAGKAAAPDGDGFYYTCGSNCKSCYNGCRKFWIQADYLLWWTKGSSVPPLITSSSQGTPQSQAGVLGQQGTTILFGDERINNGDQSGVRLQFGYWLDNCCRVGIEADYFDLEGQSSSFDATCPGDRILARPFFNVVTGQQDSELVCFPGIVVGRVNVNSSTDLHSGGLRLRKNICCKNWCIPRCCDASVRASYRVDWLAGYRYMRLDDDLTIGESLVSINPSGVLAQGTMIQVFDDFQTDNEFHGGELGLVGEYRRGRWGLKALAKVGLGNNHEVVRINGGTIVTVPGAGSAASVGGLLAQATNIGTFSQDEFAVLPEANLSLYYQVACNIRATIGYNFIYLSHVLRPGDQVDLGLNPTQIPPGTLAGAARPAFTFNDTDFWAQGFNIGLELRR